MAYKRKLPPPRAVVHLQHCPKIKTIDEAKMFVFVKTLKILKLQMCYIINGEIFLHSHYVSQRDVPRKDVILATKYPIFFRFVLHRYSSASCVMLSSYTFLQCPLLRGFQIMTL